MNTLPTILVLVRHGETDWNACGRLQGHTDIPLNAHGHAQAERLAEGLARRGERFDVLYSSDLSRARATAAPLGQALGLPVIEEPALRERHFGVLQGLTLAEAAEHHPAAYAGYRQRRVDAVPEGGESLERFCARVSEVLTRLAVRHVGGRILVVAHGGVLEMAYRLAVGIPLSAPRDFALPNAALNRFCFSSGTWKVENWADISHLEGDAFDELA